jgi:hypothetical protein
MTGPSCDTVRLDIWYLEVTCATGKAYSTDLSSFGGKSLTLVTGASQSYSISSVTFIAGCPVIYQMTVTPSNSLITLTGSTVSFAASSDLSKAGSYTVSVQT